MFSGGSRRGALLAVLPIAVASVLVGSTLSLGVFTFGYAKGYSYFTSDPTACANCHVMQDHLDAWSRGSHKAVATCNDCHMPRGFIPKYLAKAENGFWHSLGFTTGNFPDPLRIRPVNTAITERACRTCHAELTSQMDPAADLAARGAVPQYRLPVPHGEPDGSCLRCHASVGHAVH